jgi:pimeloyl-ACP methyl ester carboxylesterase
MPWQTRHVTQLGEHHIAWLEAGASATASPSPSRPVVLVHGLGTSDRWWALTIPDLAERHRVLAVDLLGFGRSAGQPVRLDVAADQLAAWADSIGLDRATWVGHSMGGIAVADLAARRPDLVERLVLVDAAGLPVSRQVTRHLFNVVRASPFMPPAAYPIAIECVLRAGPIAITRASHQILATDIEARFRSISAPTLVVWGARDRLLPPSYGRRLAATIPGATYVEIAHAGHSPMWEAPPEFQRTLDAFLAAPVAGTAERPTAAAAAPVAAPAPGLAAGVPLTAPTGGRVVNRYLPVGDWSVHVRVGRPTDDETAIDPIPIVFVHGYAMASRVWLPTLKRLARHHLVLAPDLPGLGWTAGDEPALDVRGHAQALASIMETAGIGGAVLVGTSLGSQVVAQLAADDPDRALGVILVSPTFDPAERSLSRVLWRVLADVPREWPSIWFEHLRDLALAGPRRMIATMRGGWGHRIERALPRVRVPVVVVRGSHDPLTTRSWAVRAAELVPIGHALEIQGAGRAIGQRAPAALARIVDAHVATVAQGIRPHDTGTLPIQLVTATHRRRAQARPRKARAGPRRA